MGQAVFHARCHDRLCRGTGVCGEQSELCAEYTENIPRSPARATCRGSQNHRITEW